jgi:hypothetical protein
MAVVLKAFGPVEAIVEFVGPDWADVSEPDLFDRPTRTEAVARCIEDRIKAAGPCLLEIVARPFHRRDA